MVSEYFLKIVPAAHAAHKYIRELLEKPRLLPFQHKLKGLG